MASTSIHAAQVTESKPVESSEARPVSQPATKPFTIKVASQIPS